MRREIMFIVARAENGCIGADGDVPWKISDDLRRFKRLTTGKPMVMGRKTFESLPGLLPGRRHIVLTRDESWQAEGAEVAHSPEDALALAGDGEVAVIGGAEVFDLYRDRATLWEITEIHEDTEGDTFMDGPGPRWSEVAREEHEAGGEDPAYAFVTYRRSDIA